MLIFLSNTGSTNRNCGTYYMRRVTFVAVWIFLLLKLQSFFFQPIFSTMRAVALSERDLLTPKFRNDPRINHQIAKYNHLELVLNEDLFGPLDNDSVVIVVQVHTRITYLSFLIRSLARAYGISRVLLIFSHDYYDKDINALVETINFCVIMQIFYPYPIHAHPECQQNTEKNSDHCNRAEYRYHNKQMDRAQMKHHWWWKANYIFDQLEITRYYSGLVLFLEEDYYVTKDFLYVLEMMYERTGDLCPQCNIYTLGRHGQLTMSSEYNSEIYAEVEVTPWNVENNMAFAFNRTTWNTIRKCAKYFCSHGDYNYDQSFEYMSRQCPEGKLIDMTVKKTRVFHIGACSTHIGPCKRYKSLSNVQNALRIADESNDMFPSDLKLTGAWLNYSQRHYRLKGGWDTNVDNELCMSMISPARRISPKRAKVT